jgi:hypothetical protein
VTDPEPEPTRVERFTQATREHVERERQDALDENRRQHEDPFPTIEGDPLRTIADEQRTRKQQRRDRLRGPRRRL